MCSGGRPDRFQFLDRDVVAVGDSSGGSGLYYIYVYSGLDQTLDGLLTALKPAGVTIGGLSSVVTNNTSLNAQLLWNFTVTGPLNNTQSMIQTFATLTNTLAKTNPNLSITIELGSTRASPQASLAQTCPLADLLADAKAKAHDLAGAAGRFVSGILALSTITSPGETQCTVTVKYSLVG